MMPRYVLRTGKFGHYFHDKQSGEDMPLKLVLYKLNLPTTNNDSYDHPVLDLSFDCSDFNKILTIRGYLKELLYCLITEQEGFSGKRPFGNSGWTHGLEKAMVEAQLIDGEIDKDGFLKRSDSKQFVFKMVNAIRDM